MTTQHQIDRIAEVCQRRKPIVVISCITYNHEKYLRDALEGFLMQRTEFPFVAIVHDDASTDGTSAVLREYAERYPDLILPIYEQENQYSKKDGSLGRIIRAARAATGAKYVALCEGDDYWTAPDKLQRQVAFLDSHPDYSLCFHNATVHYEDNRAPDHLFTQLESREYSEKEITDGWITATATFVFRTALYQSPYYLKYTQSTKFIVGDYPLMMTLLREGKVYGIGDALSVYRISPTGWTQRQQPTLKKIVQEIEVFNIFGGYAGQAAKMNAAIQSREALSILFKGNVRKAFAIWKLSFSFAPWPTIRENVRFAFKMIKLKFIRR